MPWERLDEPEAIHRALKANAVARGMGEFIHHICLAYQRLTAMDECLTQIERYVLELLDRQKPE
jgi:hypothetical protein